MVDDVARGGVFGEGCELLGEGVEGGDCSEAYGSKVVEGCTPDGLLTLLGRRGCGGDTYPGPHLAGLPLVCIDRVEDGSQYLTMMMMMLLLILMPLLSTNLGKERIPGTSFS